ncbi:MAG TPA: hypothetical protein VEU47_18680 [Candidatus Cybelea sp.]|nr:hypothetical protein [Candidatus Cybelea sp.]
MPGFTTIRCGDPADAIAPIMMHRPEARSAQNIEMTYELNAAIDRAAAE